MTRIIMADFRTVGVCRDARHWFMRHGLDWKQFVREGIDAQSLLDTGDQHATINRLIEAAEKREALHGR